MNHPQWGLNNSPDTSWSPALSSHTHVFRNRRSNRLTTLQFRAGHHFSRLPRPGIKEIPHLCPTILRKGVRAGSQVLARDFKSFVVDIVTLIW